VLRSDERLFFGFNAELTAQLLAVLRGNERTARACIRNACESGLGRGRRAKSECLAKAHEAQCNRGRGGLGKRGSKLQGNGDRLVTQNP